MGGGLRILSTSGGPCGTKPRKATCPEERCAKRANRIALKKRPQPIFEIPLTMDLRIPPLYLKNLRESTPLKCRFLVRGLARARPVRPSASLPTTQGQSTKETHRSMLHLEARRIDSLSLSLSLSLQFGCPGFLLVHAVHTPMGLRLCGKARSAKAKLGGEDSQIVL